MVLPKKDNTAVVIIDVQESLVKIMPPKVREEVIRKIEILLKACDLLRVPFLFTQQYTKGLGPTVEPLRGYIKGSPIEKLTFSCCQVPLFMEQLMETGAEHVVLCGIEAHICVLQTAIELQERDYKVHVMADGVCSRFKENWKRGLAYMEAEDIRITTLEIILFQLMERSGTEEFKKIIELIK